MPNNLDNIRRKLMRCRNGYFEIKLPQEINIIYMATNQIDFFVWKHIFESKVITQTHRNVTDVSLPHITNMQAIRHALK